VVDAAGAFVATSRVDTTLPAYNLRGDFRTVQDTVAAARALQPGADINALPGGHTWCQDVDDSAFRTEVGFAPSWTLEDGLADTLARL
jgi:nucleoside-diphosphate-sugar epimerase